MALIGSIRKRSGLIVTFVGLGLLLFIIPVDKIWQQFSGEENEGIGLFQETDIIAKDWNYDNRLEYERYNAREKNKTQGGDGILTDSEEDQIIQRVWNQMISEKIHAHELDKLGIGISKGKKGELNLGLLNPNNPVNSSLKDLFVENGIYYADSFAIWKRKNVDPLLNTAKGKKQLKYNYEDPLNDERKRYKYLSMIKYGVIGSHPEAKRLFAEENTKANIRYIFKNYDNISDTIIQPIEDKELKTYFNYHRYEKAWEQEQEVRVYDYVIFNIDPSDKDKESSISSLMQIKEEFINSDNDSMFVVNYAETPVVRVSPNGSVQSTEMYSNQPYSGGRFSADIDQLIDSAQNGDVIGPFKVPNQNVVQMVKIHDAGEQEEATVRHILIGSNNEDPIQKKLADSILRAVKRDTSKFTQLASKYSEDGGSSASGGIYRWFPKGQMVPEFNDYSFDKPIGSIGIVKTQFGYHIMEVLARRMGAYKKIAVVDESINVSEKTQENYYSSVAVQFYNKAKETSFETAADEFGLEIKKSGYLPLTYPDGQRNNGAYGPVELNRNQNIVRWAFNNDINTIMEPEYISNNEQLVIAVIKEVIHEGDVTFNNIKTLMKPKVTNELKADAIKSQLEGYNSIEDISSFLSSPIQEAEVAYSYVNINNNYQNTAEPKIIATIFSAEIGETSSLIEGNEGIYIVEITSKTEAKLPEDLADKSKETTDNLRGLVDQWYYYSLYMSYGVKDYRLKRNIIR